VAKYFHLSDTGRQAALNPTGKALRQVIERERDWNGNEQMKKRFPERMGLLQRAFWV